MHCPALDVCLREAEEDSESKEKRNYFIMISLLIYIFVQDILHNRIHVTFEHNSKKTTFFVCLLLSEKLVIFCAH